MFENVVVGVDEHEAAATRSRQPAGHVVAGPIWLRLRPVASTADETLRVASPRWRSQHAPRPSLRNGKRT